MRLDRRVEVSAPDAGESIWRSRGVALVVQELRAELENAALRVHRRVHGVLRHVYVADAWGVGKRPLKREIPLDVESRVGLWRHVSALEAYERLQRVEAGRYAGRLDLRNDGAKVVVAVRKEFGVQVVVAVVQIAGVAVVAEQSVVVDEHHPEAALLHVGDVLVDSLRGKVLRPVYRSVQKRVPAARHAARQVVVRLHRGDLREKRVLPRAGGKYRDAVGDARADPCERVRAH